MRNILIVIKHEILVTLAKPSFWLMTFVFPLVTMGFSLLPNLMVQGALEGGRTPTAVLAEASKPTGYVDLAGAVAQLPPDIPQGALVRYDSEAAAQVAVEAGAIGQYYLIPADFGQARQVTAVGASAAPLSGFSQGALIEYVLRYNAVGDAGLARLLVEPLQALTSRGLAPQPTGQTTGATQGFALVPFVVMFVLFFIITMTGGYMLQSVAKEKENRTAEVLLLSVRPRELMFGKVIGLGVVALLQMAVWLGGAVLLGTGALAVASILGGFRFPVTLALFALLYFLFGYLMYASALGAVGALAPTAREGAQFTFAIILPLIIPFYLNQAFANAPNGTLVTALSLIPFTAPTAMVARMAATTVPGWQIAVSLAGLAVMTYLFVLLAARFFRADTLLSATSLNWKRIISELRGRPA